jgi:hypothetical protein
MGEPLMRVFILIAAVLVLSACDRRYINCMEEALPKERTVVCHDLWQNCEKAARQRAERSCAVFKADE